MFIHSHTANLGLGPNKATCVTLKNLKNLLKNPINLKNFKNPTNLKNPPQKIQKI